MTDAATTALQPLAARKIAVLVESLYIPEEIEAYKQDFGALGATVDLMTRLWGKASDTFVSDPNGLDPNGVPRTAQTLTIDIDFEHVDLADYAAVIMSANYTSVRLRYFQPPQSPADAPAVAFFARAMMRPDIVKGALCHGLWILTPRPALLRGRRVICHEVVQADVENAGALIVRDKGTVVVDADLVTGHSKDDVHAFIQAIAGQIN
jgi:protease I